MRIGFSGLILSIVMAISPGLAMAGARDLGHGFTDYGVASPFSHSRGTVATVDGRGHDVVLIWMMDHTGGYELMLLDANDGHAEQFPVPFKNPSRMFDVPYASILSRENKFYTLYNSHFMEFDPVKHAFTFCAETAPQMAMSMTEDEHGVIWAVTYPQSGVVSFDPATRQFHDYGQVYHQDWAQYPRYVAVGKAGWVYFGVGNAASQIVAFNPKTKTTHALIPESDRKNGIAYVYRDQNGNVYGHNVGKQGQWYLLADGKAKLIDEPAEQHPVAIKTGPQSLFLKDFPDGRKIKTCDLLDRQLVIENKNGATRTFHFDYDTDGAIMMGVAAASDGSITGGSTFPMEFCSYQPKTEKWIHRPAFGQWNAITPAGKHFFIGVYPGGHLLDWQPGQPWVRTQKDKPNCNPGYLGNADPSIHRPTKVLVDPKGNWVILAGTPDYGDTGGGLMIHNRKTGKNTVLTDAQMTPNQSTESLVALPDGTVLGGTTTAPGTGGKKVATLAEMYQFDPQTRKVLWHAAMFPGAQEYTDLCLHDGLVYGIVDRQIFFVFDPTTRKVRYSKALDADMGQFVSDQGPRAFIKGPDDTVYALLSSGVARIDPSDYSLKLIARSPEPITAGGDYLDGKIYFICGSHLCSYRLAQ